VAKFIDEGSLATHIQSVRSVYARRLELLVDTCRALLPGATILEPAGGLSVAVELGSSVDEAAICGSATAMGGAVAPLSEFFVDMADSRRGLVIGMGVLAEEGISAVIGRLAEAIAHQTD
jgi:GntR family transcriptional regulator / MocR family aminotransferase